MIVSNKLKTEDIWSIVENNDPVVIDNETINKVNDWQRMFLNIKYSHITHCVASLKFLDQFGMQ